MFHCSGVNLGTLIKLEQKLSIRWASPIPATSDTAFPSPAALSWKYDLAIVYLFYIYLINVNAKCMILPAIVEIGKNIPMYNSIASPFKT